MTGAQRAHRRAVKKIGGVLIPTLALALSPAVRAELDGVDCRTIDEYTSLPDPYSRWRCGVFISPEIMATRFRIELRWNRPGLPSEATVLWLGGGDGSKTHAQFERGPQTRRAGERLDRRSVRRRLDEDFAVRSIELRFADRPVSEHDLGGYWAAPRFGFIKPSRAFVAALDYLRRADVDLLRGTRLTAVGSSNGSTVIAFALAYLGAAADLDHAVLISGPFWGDVLRECQDPGFIAHVGQNGTGTPFRVGAETIFAMISEQNGWTDCRAAGLDDRRRSALGGGAERVFAGIDIDVIVGEDDAFGPWLLRSNRYWYDLVRADTMSRTVLAGRGHSVWGVDPATQTLLVEAIAKPAGVAAPGLFTVGGRDVYYSNGSRHCRIPTMARYRELTGRDSIRSLPDYRELPRRSVSGGRCGE